jgi:hypothetical protein
MLRDQTARSKLAARQPYDDGASLAPHFSGSGRWRINNPVLIAVTAVVGLIA